MILIEHFAGAFPLWLAPEQVRVLPVSEKFVEYAELVREQFVQKGLRVSVDDSNESLGKKIRNSELMKVPYTLVVGEKEASEGTVAVRKYGKGDLGTKMIDDVVTTLLDSISKRAID